jgi:hypothetical protein
MESMSLWIIVDNEGKVGKGFSRRCFVSSKKAPVQAAPQACRLLSLQGDRKDTCLSLADGVEKDTRLPPHAR